MFDLMCVRTLQHSSNHDVRRPHGSWCLRSSSSAFATSTSSLVAAVRLLVRHRHRLADIAAHRKGLCCSHEALTACLVNCDDAVHRTGAWRRLELSGAPRLVAVNVAVCCDPRDVAIALAARVRVAAGEPERVSGSKQSLPSLIAASSGSQAAALEALAVHIS